jgi:hypothetical protein
MTSLQRPEVAVSRRILSAAASSFPQQMYWHVRPSMLAMQDAAVKAVQDAKAQVTMAVSSAWLFRMHGHMQPAVSTCASHCLPKHVAGVCSLHLN